MCIGAHAGAGVARYTPAPYFAGLNNLSEIKKSGRRNLSHARLGCYE